MKNRTIDLINDLNYKLSFRDKDDCLASELNRVLQELVTIHLLDKDPNVFASIPDKIPEPLGNVSSYKNWKDFAHSVFLWIPEKEINLNEFIMRCLHHSKESRNSARISDIKSALLHLKEDGKIELSDEGTIKKL